jgi:hypothetical protein
MQLDLRAQTICDLLEFALETGRSEEELSGEEDEGDEEDNRLQLVMEAIENGEEIDFDALEDELGGELDMEDTSSGESDEEGDNIADEEEDIIQLRSPEGDRSGSEVKGTLFDVKKSTILSKKKKGTTHGLNDDFFDLDAFNAETEQTQAKSSSRGRLAVESDGSEDESMSVDLFATLDEEEETAAVGTHLSMTRKKIIPTTLQIYFTAISSSCRRPQAHNHVPKAKHSPALMDGFVLMMKSGSKKSKPKARIYHSASYMEMGWRRRRRRMRTRVTGGWKKTLIIRVQNPALWTIQWKMMMT